MSGVWVDLIPKKSLLPRSMLLTAVTTISYGNNKLETFEDALFESSKTSTHKTEKTGTLDLLPCGKRNAEMVEIW